MTRNPMIDGRRADSVRRRQRVIKAINDATTHGSHVSVSAIARTAGFSELTPAHPTDVD